MRLALISDIHANLEALDATLANLRGVGADRVVCLGDVVGYNADAGECLARLRELDPVWIAGNHDRAVSDQLSATGFNATAARAIAWTRANLLQADLDLLAGLPLKAAVGSAVVAVHGVLHPEVGCELVRLNSDDKRRQTCAALERHPSGAHICAHGHTHRVSAYEMRGGRMADCTADVVMLRDDAHYVINPGTVGEPRDCDRVATYMILDLAK
ncbi:MAG: metallophosphoesterase family protein [Actinobacteria bacterium]|nr:metallophosphoesterase family protein [Actinomycetota bacterium]